MLIENSIGPLVQLGGIEAGAKKTLLKLLPGAHRSILKTHRLTTFSIDGLQITAEHNAENAGNKNERNADRCLEEGMRKRPDDFLIKIVAALICPGE